MVENNTWLIALSIVAVVGLVVFGAVALTGYGVKEACLQDQLCLEGYEWSNAACKCIPASNSKASAVTKCQTICDIAPGRNKIIIEEILVEQALEIVDVIVEKDEVKTVCMRECLDVGGGQDACTQFTTCPTCQSGTDSYDCMWSDLNGCTERCPDCALRLCEIGILK